MYPFRRRSRRWAIRGLGLVLLTILVVGCSTRGCGDEGLLPGLVVVYNRTQTAVRFDEVWVAACDRTSFGIADWPKAAPSQVPPPPGAVPLSVDLGVPSDYRSTVTIVVSEQGVQVTRGLIDESGLGRCSGVPPSP